MAQSSVEYEKKGVGKITLVVDGESAKILFSDTATASGSVTIQVQALGQQQKDSTALFDVNFDFIGDEVEKEKEPRVQQSAVGIVDDQIDEWREANKRRKSTGGEHPKPQIALIESTGEVVISFSQDMRVIPSCREDDVSEQGQVVEKDQQPMIVSCRELLE